MSIFTSILKLFDSNKEELHSPELLKLKEFETYFSALLASDNYIARSEYAWVIEQYADIYTSFSQLQQTQMLEDFCRKHHVDIQRVKSFIKDYEDLRDSEVAELIRKHNDDFVSQHCKSEKTYLDNILKDVDENISLDEEQRRVVLSDEDYTLVIAGAGAGKTTTVAAKVKYLVEKKGIKPEQILVISFTNKAVGELQDKINKALEIDCPVTTFHKAGYAICRRQEEERKRIVTEGYLYNVINNYLKTNILEYPEMVDKLILFFGSYFDAPYEGDDLNTFFNYITKADFTTLRGNMQEYTEKVIDQRSGRCVTIAHERMRSFQEVVIANFLYMNGIDYTYEKVYPFNILRSHTLHP